MIDDLAVLENFLLAGEDASEHLYGVVLGVELEAPHVLLLGAISLMIYHLNSLIVGFAGPA